MKKLLEFYNKNKKLVIGGFVGLVILGLTVLYILFVNRFADNFLGVFARWLEKNKEVWLYLIFGFLNTIVNFGVYFLCTKKFNLDYRVANILSWIAGVIFAFITNKYIVFASVSGSMAEVMKEFMSFVSARVATLILETVMMWVGVSLLKQNDGIVKVIAQVFVVIGNYILSKFFVFN